MKKAKSHQYKIIFSAEVCSFYELTGDGAERLLEEFERFIKINGNTYDFMPYIPEIFIEKDGK